MSTINLEDKVQRIEGPYYEVGKTGTVVELDTVNGRARIKWDHKNMRTWMRFGALAVTVQA